MIGLLLPLLLLISLEAPFGEASATAAAVDNDGLRLEVSVEVEGSPVAVVVRGVASGNLELPPVALADRGDGRWEGIVQLPVVENMRLGFESIPTRGPAAVSALNTLTDLGVDRAVFAIDDEPSAFGDDESGFEPATRRWGWLGLAAGAGALALLALWVAGSRQGEPHDDSELEPDSPVD